MSRRGFALPLVLIVLVALVTGVAVMLTRSGADFRTSARRIEAYRAEHVARGVRELLDASLRSLRPEQLVAAGNPALWREVLVVSFDDGTLIRASLRERQGSVLTEFGQLSGTALDEAARIAAALGEATEPEAGLLGVGTRTRVVGPTDISLWTSPEPVLAAVGEAVSRDARLGAEFAREIVAKRQEGQVSRSTIAQAATSAGFPATQHADLFRLVTDRPVLWEVLVTVESGVGGSVLGERLAGGIGGRDAPRGEAPPPTRYLALLLITRRGGSSVGSTLNDNSQLLSWTLVDEQNAAQDLPPITTPGR